MRSAVVAAAFAAVVIAVPNPHHAHRHAHNKRALVTDVDIVYATEVVTVWMDGHASETPAAKTPVAETPAAQSIPTPAFLSDNKDQLGDAGGSGGHASYWSSAWSSAWTSTYPSEPEATQAPKSTYIAPSSSETSPSSPPPASNNDAPSSEETPSGTSAAAGAESSPDTYNGLVTYHHNLHRKNHTVDQLTWNNTLATIALQIAQSCNYAHDTTAGDGHYGQNIAAGFPADNVSGIITDLFYNGEVGWYADLYNQAQPDMTKFEVFGHFTQVVWKGTTSVGCATVDCSANGLRQVSSDVPPYFTVCNYYPPGNVQGEYDRNVLCPPNPNATATWNTFWKGDGVTIST